MMRPIPPDSDSFVITIESYSALSDSHSTTLSSVAQGKSTGLITQGSLDRNEAVLYFCFFSTISDEVEHDLHD